MQMHMLPLMHLYVFLNPCFCFIKIMACARMHSTTNPHHWLTLNNDSSSPNTRPIVASTRCRRCAT